MPRFLLACVLLAGTIGGAAASAQDRAAQAPFVHDKADQLFVQDAVAYGLAHEQRLRLIVRAAADPALKALAAEMLPAQISINAALKTFSSRKEIPLAQDTGVDVKRVRTELSGLSGAAFDRAALPQLRRGYEVQTGLYFQEARVGLDPDIRAWAGSTLPKLQAQRDQVRGLGR